MTASNNVPPDAHGSSSTNDERPTADEGTQTNGFKDPKAAKLNKEDGKGAKRWTVESALDEITPRYAENTNSPVSFFHLLERLKTTKRAGWRRFGIDQGESISDHMYRMGILTMMAPENLRKGLDTARCTQMAIVHDMAEALVGDITPVDNVSKEDKSRRESETMDYICNKLLGTYNGGLNGQEVRALWQEYEDSVTPESIFVHDIDKVELITQMVEYERVQKCEKDYGEFTWVSKKIVLPEMKEWSDQLLRERQQLWRELGKEPTWAEGTRPTDKQASS